MAVAGPRLTSAHWPADASELVLETTVGRALREAARLAPETVALIDGLPDPAARRRCAYPQLLADSERVAAALLAQFEPGERIAIWSPNSFKVGTFHSGRRRRCHTARGHA